MTKIIFLIVSCMALLLGLAACGSKPSATSYVPAVDGSGPGKVSIAKAEAVTPDGSAGITRAAVGTAGADGNGLVITPEIKGQSFLLHVGDTFEVQIPTFPAKEYTWQPKDLDTTILAEVGDPVFTADSAIAGSGGIVTLKFKVVGPGTTELSLLYTRAATNGVPSMYANSFGVTIEAK